MNCLVKLILIVAQYKRLLVCTDPVFISIFLDKFSEGEGRVVGKTIYVFRKIGGLHCALDKFKFSPQSPATLDPHMVIFKMCGYMLLLLVHCSLFNGYILLLLRCTNGDAPKLHGLFCIFVQVKGTNGIFYSSNILEHCKLIGTILGIKDEYNCPC